ncbi:hypothetical protein KY359_02810 [Candidatus Woesearchaeota archaeon]|nr:hypothetical protein [Candidatus Woesearchaeota archaeon]
MEKMMDLRYVVIGSHTDKRPQLYKEGITSKSGNEWAAAGVGRVEIEHHSWCDFVRGDVLTTMKPGEERVIVRLFSPWAEEMTYSMAVDRGAEVLSSQGRMPKRIRMDHRDALLLNSIIATEGMKGIILDTGRIIEAMYPGAHRINPIPYVLSATDKKIESDMLQENGIAHPFTVTDAGSAEEVIELLRGSTRTDTLYIKPRGGSSGELISILRLRGGAPVLKTGLREVDGSYVVDKQLKEVTEPKAIEDTINLLLDLGVVVQEGVAKVSEGGKNFDIRMHVINMGVPYHYFRMSETEITNISGGGTGKFDPGAGFGGIPAEVIERGRALSQRIAEHYQVFDFGSDIICTPDFRNVYVLETNAFPSCFDGAHQVFDVYRHEVETTLRRITRS